MSAARWAWELCGLDGTPVAALTPSAASVTRKLNDPGEVSIELRADTVGALEVRSTSHIVRGWRGVDGGARVLRFAGVVSSVVGAAATGAADTVTVAARDPFAVLLERAMQEAASFTAQTPRAIVAALVAAQNVRAGTHLRVAAGTGGPLRDRSYELGKRVGEAIVQLSEVVDGFWWVVDPVDDGATIGELSLRHPAPGAVNDGASWEYGAGTANTLAEASVQTRPPVNHVLALGAGEGPEQLVAVATSPASIAEHGLYDAVLAHVDVSLAATLQGHADDALRADPRRTVSGRAARAQVDGAHVPALWDDFDVGDNVPVVVRHDAPAASYDGRAVVTSVRVDVDAAGREHIAALELLDVANV